MANEAVFLGRVSGPATSTIGNVAVWANTTGSLLADGSGGGAFVSSITGTANQITASAATGAVTLSIPSTFVAPGSIAATTTVAGTEFIFSGGQSLVGTTANVTELYNSTSPQSEYIYNTRTNSTNYERGQIAWASNILRIATTAAGTGTGTRSIRFATNDVSRWDIDGTNGHLLAVTDNTYDIGASGATRPRSIYAGTSVVSPLFNAGAAVNVTFGPSGVANAIIQANSRSITLLSGGALVPHSNGGVDLGATATRFGDIWSNGNITLGGNIVAGAQSSYLFSNLGGFKGANTDGIVKLVKDSQTTGVTLSAATDGTFNVLSFAGADTATVKANKVNGTAGFQFNGTNGFTGTGIYTTLTIQGGIITNAV